MQAGRKRMASTKLIFNEDEVQRLQTKIGQVSQDTNRLYLQLKGQASGWGGIPMGDHLVKAQVLINELTVEAEKLEDVIRTALKGVEGLREENKQKANELAQKFSLFAGMFGSFRAQSIAGQTAIPTAAKKAASNLITSFATLSGRDELDSDPAVKQLRMSIQTSGLGTIEGIAAQSKLKDIFAARDEIAKAQMAFKVYEAFGNKTQMEAVHAQAEEARQKLASLGVAKVHYEAGKDLSVYFKQPAVKACDYDPSIRAESVPLIHNEEYLLLLRLAMEKSAAGAYARSQLEAKRLEIEAAERQLALDNQASAKKYNFDEYSKTLIGNTWVLSKNGKTDREAAQASMAYNEAIKNGEIKSNLDNVPVDIMLEQILAAKDGRNYWTGEEISKLQAYGIIFSSLVTTFQWIEGVRGNVKIKRSFSLHSGASEISASKVKKLKVPLSEGTGNLRQISSGGLRNEIELTSAQRNELVDYLDSQKFCISKKPANRAPHQRFPAWI
jgi:predicted hydrocarbon binding protein